MNLFQKINFTSHSGLPLTWKLECDAITEAEWDAITYIISQRIPFKSVRGIPRGGLKFADALEKYKSDGRYILLVDDVWTTGRSMEEARAEMLKSHDAKGKDILGVVLFSRDGNLCPDWVIPVFSLNKLFCSVK